MSFLYDAASNQPKNKLDMEMIARRVSGKTSDFYEYTIVPFCLGFIGCAILIAAGSSWVLARIYDVLKRIAA